MSDNRTPIESLFNLSLGLRKPFEGEFVRSNSLVFYNRANGKVLGFINNHNMYNANIIYDVDGNFFADSQN